MHSPAAPMASTTVSSTSLPQCGLPGKGKASIFLGFLPLSFRKQESRLNSKGGKGRILGHPTVLNPCHPTGRWSPYPQEEVGSEDGHRLHKQLNTFSSQVLKEEISLVYGGKSEGGNIAEILLVVAFEICDYVFLNDIE